jgi:proline dehydrogenase
VIIGTGSGLRRLLGRRARAGRDPVELARESVDAGCLVACESDDAGLVERLASEGLAAACELTVRVDRIGVDAARGLGERASDAGLSIALAGPPLDVDAVGLPGGRVVVPAAEPGAEDRCRALAGRRVRLVGRRRRGPDLAFVRCLNVLMAGEGQPGIAVSDPRLIAIAGERAAWNGRPSDSWELVMPYGELVSERQRLVAAGSVVRLVVGDPS